MSEDIVKSILTEEKLREEDVSILDELGDIKEEAGKFDSRSYEKWPRC